MPPRASLIPPPNTPRRRSILVIEDEPLVLDVILSALQSRGFEQAPAGAAPGSVRLFHAVGSDGAAIDVVVATVDTGPTGVVSLATRDDRDPARALGSLTRRQMEVLRLVALGKTNAEIAEIRGTTVAAVDRTIVRAFATLGIDGEPGVGERVDAARRATSGGGAPA